MFLKSIRMAAVLLLPVAISCARAADPNEALDRVMDLEKPFSGNAKDLLDFLSDKYKVQISIDEAAFAKAKLDSPRGWKVDMRPMADVSLDTALRLVLPQFDSVYEVRGPQLAVVPDTRDGQRRSFPPLSEAQRKVQQTFRERISKMEVEIPKPFEGDLKDILQYLQDRYEFVCVIDRRSFERTAQWKNVESARVKLPAQKTHLTKMLEDIAEQVEGKYLIQLRYISIVPGTKSKS